MCTRGLWQVKGPLCAPLWLACVALEGKIRDCALQATQGCCCVSYKCFVWCSGKEPLACCVAQYTHMRLHAQRNMLSRVLFGVRPSLVPH